METSYEMIDEGNGKVEFINKDMEAAMYLDDRRQYDELIGNGTLCSRCGELNENLIGEDKILKTPNGEKFICDKCKGGNENE